MLATYEGEPPWVSLHIYLVPSVISNTHLLVNGHEPRPPSCIKRETPTRVSCITATADLPLYR